MWGQSTRPLAKHGMAITGPLLAASRVIKARSAWGTISTSQTTSPDVAHSQDVGAPTDTHLRSQLLQTKHSQRWSLHPGPRSQELSSPFSRRHCLGLNRCCLPPAPKVSSSSTVFELGRQTSFAHLFKVGQVPVHTHTSSVVGCTGRRSECREGLWQCTAFRLSTSGVGTLLPTSSPELSTFSPGRCGGTGGCKAKTSVMGDAPSLCLWVGTANSCMGSTGRHRASVTALQLLGLKNRQLLIA